MRVFHAVGYSLHEAFVDLWRNRLVNLVSIATIAVSLFILGIFVSVSTNLRVLLSGWSQRVQLSVYLSENRGEEDVEEIQRLLADMPEVESFEYVSKNDAVNRFRSYFPELGTLPDLLDSNPLPASLEIQVAPEHRSPDEVERLARRLGEFAGVDEVDYDLLWIKRLTAVIELTRALGFFIGGALVVASVFTIFNVIKLTVYGRQDEIGIMRLVGATHGYIRGPFLVEGMLQGGLGGLLALVFLYATHELLVRESLASFELIAGGDWLRFLSPTAWVAIVVGGMIVGLLGSALSVRRFLANPV